MPIPDRVYPRVVEADIPSLAGRTVACTGCTTGTGYHAMVAAARKGAALLLLLNRKSARSATAEAQIASESRPGMGAQVVTVDCDLQNFASTRAAADEVIRRVKPFGGLDVLMNNAGVMGVPDTRTADGFDMQMQTNHLSHFLLTALLLPALESAASTRGEARVVQHSSSARGSNAMGAKQGGGHLEARFFERSAPDMLGGDDMPACFARYHQTKLANPVFAMELHERLQAARSKVKSLCCEPGASQTTLVSNLMAGHVQRAKELGKEPPNNPFAPAGSKKAASTNNPAEKPKQPRKAPAVSMQSGADGACPLLLAAFSLNANSGDFYMPEGGSTGYPVRCMVRGQPGGERSEKIAKAYADEALTMHAPSRAMLWERSEAATGVSFGLPGASMARL